MSSDSATGLSAVVRKLYGEAHERVVIVGAGCSAEAGLPTGDALQEEIAATNPLYAGFAAELNESSDVERVFRVIEMISTLGEPNSESADFARIAHAQLSEDNIASAKEAIEEIRQ